MGSEKKWLQAFKEELVLAFSKIKIGPDGVIIEGLLSDFKKACKIISSNESVDSFDVMLKIHFLINEQFDIFSSLPKGVKNFEEHFGKDKIAEVVSLLADYFSKIPMKYSVILELPQIANMNCTNIALTKAVLAIDCRESEKEPPGVENLSGEGSFRYLMRSMKKDEKEEEQTDEGFYLSTGASGFWSSRNNCRVTLEAIERFKQVIFLLIKEEILEIGPEYDVATLNVKLPRVKILNKSFDEGIKDISISQNFRSILQRLRVVKNKKSEFDEANKKYLDYKKKNKCDETPSFRTILTMPHEPKPILNIHEKFCTVIDSEKNIENTLPFKNSLVWGFDAITNEQDPITAFVQLSIALEAVLGVDSDKNGKTRLLSDRCAFIIGRNRLERQQIRGEFEKFYNLRSDLVHGAKTDMDDSFQDLKRWGEWALWSILKKEVIWGRLE